jgi:hypothetical protein
MGQKYLVQGGNRTRMSQIPISKIAGVTTETIQAIANRAGIDISRIDLDELNLGMNEELEHEDITNGDEIMTMKIALAHLKSMPDYYTRLKAMEENSGISIPKTQSSVNQTRYEADEDVK